MRAEVRGGKQHSAKLPEACHVQPVPAGHTATVLLMLHTHTGPFLTLPPPFVTPESYM